MFANLPFRSNRLGRAIDTYWDAVVEQAPAEPIHRDPVDAESAATIRQLHEMAGRPAPREEFGERLLAQLSASLPESAPSQLPDTNHHQGRSDMIIPATIAAPLPLPSLGQSESPIDLHSRRALLSLAAAILIALGGLGGYLAQDRYFGGAPSPQPAFIPAPQATPESSPAASAGWTTTRGDAARTGLADAGPIGGPVELWRVQPGDECRNSPVVVAGTLYTLCGESTLIAFDTSNGQERWRFTADAPIAGGPTIADGTAYVVDGDGAVLAIDLENQENIWRTEGQFAGAPPAVADGLVAVPTWDGSLVGLDATTGEIRWSYLIADGVETRTAAIAGGLVYAGSTGGGLVAVDAVSGELVWQADTGSDPTATAVVAEGIAYIGSAPSNPVGFLAAFDARTGDPLWRIDEAVFTPAVSDGIGVSSSNHGLIYAFDTATGAERWRVQTAGFVRPGAIAGDIVYFANDEEQMISVFDLATGATLWTVPVDGGMNDGPAVHDGVLYAATLAGSVYAIGGDGTAIDVDPANVATPDGADEAASPTSDIATPSADEATTDANGVTFLWASTGGPEPLQRPVDVAVHPDGTISVVSIDRTAITDLAPDGSFLGTWGSEGTGPGQFLVPTGIAVDADGNIYVADEGRDDIQKFDADRNFVLSWGSSGTGEQQFLVPVQLGLDDQGNVYVPDGGHQTVRKFSPDGALLMVFGGPGLLNGPSGPAVDEDGNLVVAEVENQRVSRFAPGWRVSRQLWEQAALARDNSRIPVAWRSMPKASSTSLTSRTIASTSSIDLVTRSSVGASEVPAMDSLTTWAASISMARACLRDRRRQWPGPEVRAAGRVLIPLITSGSPG